MQKIGVSSCVSSTLTYINELCNTSHLSSTDQSIELLIKIMKKKQMNRVIAHIRKIIKERIEGNLNKSYDWYN